MGVLKQLFGPSKDEIWLQLSQDIGARFSEGGFFGKSKVTASHGVWHVTLDTHTVSTGKSSATFTRMRAPFVNPGGFRFRIYRKGIFTGLGKMLGMQDIEIGDPSFDDEFVVQSASPELIMRFLMNPHIKQLIQAQPGLDVQVKDDESWFAHAFPEGVDELYFQTLGVIKDKDRLKALFNLFALLLDELCRFGSAAKSDPGIDVR